MSASASRSRVLVFSAIRNYTINLQRSQLEIQNVGMANHNQGHHCCSQTQPTKESHIETKIEGLLEKFKHELGRGYLSHLPYSVFVL
jgi:hypothetical protein